MKKIFLFLLLASALASCVKDVVLEAQEDPFLAVYCVLKVDSVQEMKLSYTKGATKNEAPLVTEATAVLTDLTEGREAGRFMRVSDSLWRLVYSAVPTHRYHLEITVPGRNPVWAEQTMPAEPPVEILDAASLTPQDVPWLGNLDKEHLLPDVPEADDITIQIMKVAGTFFRFSSSGNYLVFADSYDRESGQYVISEELCTDFPYVDNINLTGKVWKGFSIPDDWTTSSWTGMSYSESYLKGVTVHRNFLRLPKVEEQTQFVFVIDGGTYTKYPADYIYVLSHLYFASLSDEYNNYISDAYQQYYAEQSHDMSTIYLRDNMYSNIHGGIGIFGSATIIPIRWERVGVSVWAYKPGGFPLPI